MGDERGVLERRTDEIIALLADHQEEALQEIRDRSGPVLEAVTDAVRSEARPHERLVAVVDLIFQGALECIAIAAGGDRATLLEGEEMALKSVRSLDRAMVALYRGEQERFIEEMRKAEAALAAD